MSSSSPSTIRLPPIRPMLRATRASLFEREVTERLAGAAIEILLGGAEVLSEGRFADDGAGGPWFGSTMLTIDLGRLGSSLREAVDARAAQRAALLVAADPRVTARMRQVAASEAERLAGRRLGVLSTEIRVRAEGTRLKLDVEVEAAPQTRLEETAAPRPRLALVKGGR
jgi:hypothetical protein